MALPHHYWSLGRFILLSLCLRVAGSSLEKLQQHADLSGTACPSSIEDTGNDPINWPTVHHMDTFLSCSHVPKLFTMGLNTMVDHPYLRTVTSHRGSALSARADDAASSHSTQPLAETDIEMRGGRTDGEGGSASEAEEGVLEMTAYLGQIATTQVVGERPTVLFAHYEDTALGFFGGSHVEILSIVDSVIDAFVELIRAEGVGRTLLFQGCGELSSRRTIGITVDTRDGADAISNVHSAVSAWSKGECATGFDSEFDAGNHKVWMIPVRVPEESSPSQRVIPGPRQPRIQRDSLSAKTQPREDCKTVPVDSGGNCGIPAGRCDVSRYDLHPDPDLCPSLMPGEMLCCNQGSILQPKANDDGTCVDTQVKQGDTCSELASECGISIDQLQEFNSGDDGFCPGLMPGQRLCCTLGELASHSPKLNDGGTCMTHTLTDTDLCYELANKYEVSVDELVGFNEGKTWGWKGCDLMYPGTPICVGPGSPPLPETADAICGPQKPGTVIPTDGTELADLNPCPLNACCNGWGWCGITEEHCTPPEDGDPLTAAKSDRCISNCGMSIVNNGTPPAEFISVAYFEAWNAERPCLWMDADDIDTSRYTHVHYAFAQLASDLSVDVSSNRDQFDRFINMRDIKRIVSFGGWIDPADERYDTIRNGVQQPEAFAQNLVDFVADYDLDGLDIDWEYPEAPDVSTNPEGPADGELYLEFLKVLREMLPSDKSLSIAAPASFWFLRGFPQIDQMAEHLDYIVYMTYDLHGQWDWGSVSSQSGCPDGNCLRSHVNMTETMSALSLITKAGVSSTKIVVGVSSYGRSFKMTDGGCTGPECTYVGRESGAKKGVCTGEAGYLANAEIEKIAEEGEDVQLLWDPESQSNILVYDGLEWVAYMNESTKEVRKNLYRDISFAGIADWAVDLQEFSANELSRS